MPKREKTIDELRSEQIVSDRNERERRWCHQRGLKPVVDGEPCPMRLVGRRHGFNGCLLCEAGTGTGWRDHARLYRGGDGSLIFCSQPYQLPEPKRAELSAFASAHGLSVTIGGDSWWAPGSTIFIEVSRATADTDAS